MNLAAQFDSWLAVTEEEAIEPGMPICDRQPSPLGPVGRPIFVRRPSPRHRGQLPRVSEKVVECRSMYRQAGPSEMQSVGETEFLQGITSGSVSGQYGATAVAAGIVGYADFKLGSIVTLVLEAHADAAKGRFRGVGCTAAWDASPDIPVALATSPGLLLDQKWRKGFGCLQQFGLTFDAIVYHPQLPELAALARAFPDITIILNHLGRPLGVGPYAGRRDEIFQDWKRGITEVAACPNVVVRVGGLGNPISGFDWHQRPLPPTSPSGRV